MQNPTCRSRGSCSGELFELGPASDQRPAAGPGPADSLVLNRGVDSSPQPPRGTQKRSHAATARVSLALCPLWFMANMTYNLSLSRTSVSSWAKQQTKMATVFL